MYPEPFISRDLLEPRMSSYEAVMTAMAHIYGPLLVGQLRCIKLESIEPQIKCTLGVYDMTDVKDTYFALSYEWGPRPDDQDMEIITVNGNVFPVWPSLAAALRVVYSVRATIGSALLWTDFICLNQSDRAEKEVQVPLMEKIYVNAKSVLGYLGPKVDGVEYALSRIKESVDKWRAIGSPETPNSLEAIDMDEVTEPIWIAIRGLFARGYFRRVWIWQEAALAKELLLLCAGLPPISWDYLSQFQTIITRLNLLKHLNDPERVRDRTGPTAALSMLQAHRNRYHANGSGGEHLPALLNLFRILQVGLPVDRIWGSVALWHTDIRHDLEPLGGVNYTDDYSVTYSRVARYYMPRDRELLFLSVADSIEKNELLPSWCPDWNSRMAFENFGGVLWFTAGVNPGIQRLSSIRLGADNNIIKVAGVLVDEVQEVVDGGFVFTNIREEIPAKAAMLMHWEAECLRLSQRTYQVDGIVPRHHWRALIADSLDDRDTHVDAEMDLSTDYHRFKELFSAYAQGNLVHGFGGKILAALNRYASAVQAACEGRKFFATKRGRVGIGPPRVRVDDQVVAFDSAGPLFVLHKLDEHPDIFSLVGDAFVCNLMSWSQVQEHKIGERQTYTLR